MDIKLECFIQSQVMTPEIAEQMTNPFVTVNLPTETVVTEPTFVVPRQTRAYRTDLYIVDGNVVNYRQLHELRGPEFKGTIHERGVYLIEVWDNVGDCGQVSWTMLGWKFIETNVLDEQTDLKERTYIIEPTNEDRDAWHAARRKALDNA